MQPRFVEPTTRRIASFTAQTGARSGRWGWSTSVQASAAALVKGRRDVPVLPDDELARRIGLMDRHGEARDSLARLGQRESVESRIGAPSGARAVYEGRPPGSSFR
jgi:hypothetical protein